TFHLHERDDEPERHEHRNPWKLMPGHGGERELIESADGGERDDRRADGAPRDGCGVGEEVEDCGLEGRVTEADHHGAGDGDGSAEAGVPSMIAPNENAMRSTCSRRSNEMWTIDSLTISNCPVMTVIV